MRSWLIFFLVLTSGLLTAACVLLWLGNIKMISIHSNDWTWFYYFCVILAFPAGGMLAYSFLHRLSMELLFFALASIATVSFIGVCYIQMDSIMNIEPSDVKISSLLLGLTNGVIIPVLIFAILYQKKRYLNKI
jgi:hypothetical protein